MVNNPNTVIDIYGHKYQLYSGKIYITKNESGFGNVAAYMPNPEADQKKINNGLHVIWYGKITKENIEEAIILHGWRLEDWL